MNRNIGLHLRKINTICSHIPSIGPFKAKFDYTLDYRYIPIKNISHIELSKHLASQPVINIYTICGKTININNNRFEDTIDNYYKIINCITKNNKSMEIYY
jgi:hypothetical protein